MEYITNGRIVGGTGDGDGKIMEVALREVYSGRVYSVFRIRIRVVQDLVSSPYLGSNKKKKKW